MQTRLRLLSRKEEPCDQAVFKLSFNNIGRRAVSAPAAVSVSCAYVLTSLRELRRRAGLAATRAGFCKVGEKLLAWACGVTARCEALQCWGVVATWAVMLAILLSPCQRRSLRNKVKPMLVLRSSMPQMPRLCFAPTRSLRSLLGPWLS